MPNGARGMWYSAGMTVLEDKSRRYSVEEYLRIADESEEKLEYIDGEIMAMSGGTYNHSLIISNTLRELGNRLKGKPCRALDSNMRVGIPGNLRFMYPDIPVVCGEAQFDPRDIKNLTLINPRLVVEVLSPGTERHDRGEKFTLYRELKSLHEYVLVSQDRPMVEAYFRQADGTWLFSPCLGLTSVAWMRSLEIDLPLSEIYDGVKFPAGTEEAGSAKSS